MSQQKNINFNGKDIIIKALDGVNIEDALNFKPTQNWFENMKLQKNLYLDELEFREVFYFGTKPGFVTWSCKVRDHNLSLEDYTLKYGSQNGYYLPGYVFCRGNSVSILPILSCKEDNTIYTALVEQARIPIGKESKLEIPAGILSDTDGNIKSAALDEIKQELDIKDLNLSNLVDLGSIYWGESVNKWTTSCGALDEHIISFAFHKNITKKWIHDTNGKLTGENNSGERIKVKIIRLDNLMFKSRDSKSLVSYLLYERLLKYKLIDKKLNKLGRPYPCSCNIT